MRLINVQTFGLEEFSDDRLPRYAILSHTWENDEVSLRDMDNLETAMEKGGFAKIRFTCEQAHRERLYYAWVDTCCIDKSSSAELQECINSMFQWYANAESCYVYLADIMSACPFLSGKAAQVDPEDLDSTELVNTDDEFLFWSGAFKASRWFTRGWTLQELLAPKQCMFFNRSWSLLGHRKDLTRLISSATNIDEAILEGNKEISSASIGERMSWAANRKTLRLEDRAYSMLGIFGVNLPMLYGEGSKAFLRLQEEIIKTSTDHSIFAWVPTSDEDTNRLLATSPDEFAQAYNITQWGHPSSFELTNRGLRITLPLIPTVADSKSEYLAVLNCRHKDDPWRSLAMKVGSYNFREGFYNIFTEGTRLAVIYASDLIVQTAQALVINRRYEPESHRLRFEMNIDAQQMKAQSWFWFRRYSSHGSWKKSKNIDTLETGPQKSVRGVICVDHSRRSRSELVLSERYFVLFGCDQRRSLEDGGARRLFVPCLNVVRGINSQFTTPFEEQLPYLTGCTHHVIPCLICQKSRSSNQPPDFENSDEDIPDDHRVLPGDEHAIQQHAQTCSYDGKETLAATIVKQDTLGATTFVISVTINNLYELEDTAIQKPEPRVLSNTFDPRSRLSEALQGVDDHPKSKWRSIFRKQIRQSGERQSVESYLEL